MPHSYSKVPYGIASCQEWRSRVDTVTAFSSRSRKSHGLIASYNSLPQLGNGSAKPAQLPPVVLLRISCLIAESFRARQPSEQILHFLLPGLFPLSGSSQDFGLALRTDSLQTNGPPYRYKPTPTPPRPNHLRRQYITSNALTPCGTP